MTKLSHTEWAFIRQVGGEAQKEAMLAIQQMQRDPGVTVVEKGLQVRGGTAYDVDMKITVRRTTAKEDA